MGLRLKASGRWRGKSGGSNTTRHQGIEGIITRKLWFVGLSSILVASVIAAPRLQEKITSTYSTVDSCATDFHAMAWQRPSIFASDKEIQLDTMVNQLIKSQVVFVGEDHTRYDHHQNQLEIICHLHQLDTQLAIGLEAFQQPFQPYLDDYVAGLIDDDTLIKSTEYIQRWGYDFRLYRPILHFARKHQIPLVALNIPTELTKKVAARGVAGLTRAERTQIPKIMDRSNEQYRSRLEAIFAHHPKHASNSFQNFLEAQLLWDEGMAERIANYSKTNPTSLLVVLAGHGHVAWPSGIPDRLKRRLDLTTTVLANVNQPAQLNYLAADFGLVSKARWLDSQHNMLALETL